MNFIFIEQNKVFRAKRSHMSAFKWCSELKGLRSAYEMRKGYRMPKNVDNNTLLSSIRDNRVDDLVNYHFGL